MTQTEDNIVNKTTCQQDELNDVKIIYQNQKMGCL